MTILELLQLLSQLFEKKMGRPILLPHPRCAADVLNFDSISQEIEGKCETPYL